MLQALRDEHALALLTWKPVDLGPVNRYFGTSLRSTDLAVLTQRGDAGVLALGR
jgi:hypothetical protein